MDSNRSAGGRDIPKRARKSLNLDVKMEVLRRYEAGQTTSEIHHALNLSRSTCCTIRSNASKIKAKVEARAPLSVQSRSCSCLGITDRMERRLEAGPEEQTKRKNPPSRVHSVCSSLYEHLKASEECDGHVCDTANTKEDHQVCREKYKCSGMEENTGNQVEIKKQEEGPNTKERNKSVIWQDVGFHERAYPRTTCEITQKGEKSAASYCTVHYCMDSKRPAGGREIPKRARKSLTLEVKMEVLRRYEAGQTTTEIHHALNLSRSTCCTIRSNAGKIKASVQAGTPLSVQYSSYTRPNVMDRMEKMLAAWLEEQSKRKNPLSQAIVCAKARSLYEHLKASKEGHIKAFTASHGWLHRFKHRFGFKNVKTCGEVVAADKAAVRSFVFKLQEVIKSGGYSAKQVFNVDETSLFWKKMPDSTYISVEEKTAPGFKAAKDHLTLLLGSNAEGNYKLKPLVIYHAENPRALKGCMKAFLPVHWYANKRGWMTGTIFQQYLAKELHTELQEYCKKEGLPFRILLLLDSAPCHPATIQESSENITVFYLPPNIASFLQPMDQGAIKVFKSYYLRSVLDDLLKQTNERGITAKEYWKAFNIKDAVQLVKSAWQEVSAECMKGVWKKLCPKFCYGSAALNIEHIVIATNQASAETANRAGLAEEPLDEADIQQLLESHREEFSNEDLVEMEKEWSREEEQASTSQSQEEAPEQPVRNLNVRVLHKILTHVSAALNLMEENDPDTNRRSLAQCRIRDAVADYEELLRQKQKTWVKLDTLVMPKVSSPAVLPFGSIPSISALKKEGPSLADKLFHLRSPVAVRLDSTQEKLLS